VVFLDTGFLVALQFKEDQHHRAAWSEWARLRASRPRVVTTSMVLAEVVNFFVSRDRHAEAVRLGRELLQETDVQMIHVDETLLRQGFEYLSRRPDKRYSLTDCVSFVLMRQLGITEALAFDAHFTQAGFVRLPHAST
jgi:predicted nucleic acid-binding protein